MPSAHRSLAVLAALVVAAPLAAQTFDVLLPAFDDRPAFQALVTCVANPDGSSRCSFDRAAPPKPSLRVPSQFSTIQACATAATPGDVCLVAPGVYPERVRTTWPGVIFKADGLVTMQGFDVRHADTTVDGFDVTGYTVGGRGLIHITGGGSRCRIVNNTLRDGLPNVYGINIYTSSRDDEANDCVFTGNRLDNLHGTFLTTGGTGHLFERNTFERQNSRDYVRLFGVGHVFRRNVFWKGTTIAGVGNHPDFVQTFGGAGLESRDHLFEENWIADLPSQFGQMNSHDGTVSKGILYDNVRNVTFRRNIVASVSLNVNIGMPTVRFENNTFYRLAYEGSGINFGGSPTRGYAPDGLVTSNVFLSGGFRAATGDSGGFYAVAGQLLSREAIGVFITSDPTQQLAVTRGIFADLQLKGYINPNGTILPKALTLGDPDVPFELDSAYASYQAAVYDLLLRTVQMDTETRATFYADYNFVAGAASAGFSAKRGCPVAGDTRLSANFCEPHGINGGDPRLRDLANPLGPDGVPFTLDDGLKPLPDSPLCGKGEGGEDIGAYSCDPAVVLSGAPPPVIEPPLPSAIASWRIDLYTRGGITPLSSTPVTFAEVTCGLTPLGEPLGTGNPTTLQWDDPARLGQVCRSTQTALLGALPAGLYDGTLTALTEAGVETLPSNRAAFEIVP